MLPIVCLFFSVLMLLDVSADRSGGAEEEVSAGLEILP